MFNIVQKSIILICISVFASLGPICSTCAFTPCMLEGRYTRNTKMVKSDNLKRDLHIMMDQTRKKGKLNIEALTASKGFILPSDELEKPNEYIPCTMSEAINRFFFDVDHGPSITVVTILCLIFYRISPLIDMPVKFNDVYVALTCIIFWWLQEHLIHDKLLHSDFDWIGKSIHKNHHDNPYFSIAIDPPHLLLGWLLVAHLLACCILPLHLALSATIAYAIAGMWYEWTHFIVHTKVKPKSHFMKRVRDNHMRHHNVNENYWFAFTLPFIDTLMRTSPTVLDARKEKRRKRNNS